MDFVEGNTILLVIRNRNLDLIEDLGNRGQGIIEIGLTVGRMRNPSGHCE